MRKVAVLGGGPAGAFAAEKLARAGLETILLDEKLAWEKPCGGGITYKAYERYPFLRDNDTPAAPVPRSRKSASWPSPARKTVGASAPAMATSTPITASLPPEPAIPSATSARSCAPPTP
jgi:choline dehydrogenase-like flavoprotein